MLSMDTKHALDTKPALDASNDLPPIDERLIAPESRYEIYDGELAYVSPAAPPHGTRHSKLSALVEAYAHPAFEVASDTLTRTSETSDVAPDVSVYPLAEDPATGGRQLEQLAFEVVSTERLSRTSRKAGMLADRGVRRVFAIDIEHERALEWSRAIRDWEELDPTGQIEDPALAVPLPIAEMLTSASADDAMARALIAKGNPEIETVRAKDRQEGLQEGRNEGLREGRDEGLREGRNQGVQAGLLLGKSGTLMFVLAERGVAVSSLDRERILAETDLARLDRWIARAARCTDIEEVFAVP